MKVMKVMKAQVKPCLAFHHLTIELMKVMKRSFVYG